MTYQPPRYPRTHPGRLYPVQGRPRPKHNPIVIVVGIALGFLMLGFMGVGIAATDRSDNVTATSAPVATEEQAADDPVVDDETFNLSVGSTITITGDDGSVAEATLRSVKSFEKGCNDLGPDPDNGRYVVFDVIVQQTKGTGSVNPLDFEFVADDGTSADSLSGVFSGCDEPSLTSTNSLRAGQKRAGKMAFDAGSKEGALEWAPGGLGADAVGSWTTS
jgi:hypothetical protein